MVWISGIDQQSHKRKTMFCISVQYIHQSRNIMGLFKIEFVEQIVWPELPDSHPSSSTVLDTILRIFIIQSSGYHLLVCRVYRRPPETRQPRMSSQVCLTLGLCPQGLLTVVSPSSFNNGTGAWFLISRFFSDVITAWRVIDELGNDVGETHADRTGQGRGRGMDIENRGGVREVLRHRVIY